MITCEDDNALIASLKYFKRSVLYPHQVFKNLKDETSIKIGFILIALKWGLCEFYVYYLWSTNQVLFAEPWLNIPAEVFRYYQLFYYIPFGFIVWILDAGLAQTLARSLGGTGTFENCLNIMGIIVFTPFVFIDSVDALYMILNQGNWSFTFNTITRLLYVFWSTLLLWIGLRVSHELSSVKSGLVSVFCNGFSILVNVIFIR